MTWALLKGYMKVKTYTFKMKGEENLFLEAIAIFTSDMWSEYVKHVQMIIDQ